MSGSAYASCASAIFFSMLALWGIYIPLKDPTFIDAFWGMGFLMQSLLCLPFARYSLHSLLLTAIVGMWAVRLSSYLFRRWRKNGQDPRYAKLLSKLGGNPTFTSLYAIFLAQGLAMWIIGLPIQYAAATHARLSLRKLLGAVIAIGGLLTESLADYQMTKFRAKNPAKDRVCDIGLWSYSRHPNHFGSSVFWWGIYLFTSSGLISWTIIAPIYMTFLLVAVTGVPTVENEMRDRPEYQAYMRRTHVFIPWFHKTGHSSATAESVKGAVNKIASRLTGDNDNVNDNDNDNNDQDSDRSSRRRRDNTDDVSDDSSRKHKNSNSNKRDNLSDQGGDRDISDRDQDQDRSDRSDRSQRNQGSDRSERNERNERNEQRGSNESSLRRSEGKPIDADSSRRRRQAQEVTNSGQ